MTCSLGEAAAPRQGRATHSPRVFEISRYDTGVISGLLLFIKEDLHTSTFEQSAAIGSLSASTS
jgi:hypothetical protein